MVHWNSDCDSLFEPEMYNSIVKENYDLAMIDPVVYVCLYALPYKLGIPYISLSVPFGLWTYR